MRRIFNESPSSPSDGSTYPTDGTVYGNRTGHTTTAPSVRYDSPFEPGESGKLSSQIKSSQAYLRAYELMKDYPEWLVRLDAIVSSAVRTAPSFGDVFTNKAYNADQVTLSNAYAAISNLVAEFNQWKNSLPSEQVSQQIEAGLNPAMMNQSASSQSPNAMSGTATATGSSSENFGSILGGLSSFISSTSGGLFGLVTTAANTFTQLFKNELDAIDSVIRIADSGYEMPNFEKNPILQKYGDIFSGTDKYKNITFQQKLNLLKTDLSLRYMNGLFTHFSPNGFVDPLNDIAKLNASFYKNEVEYKLSQFKFLKSKNKFETDFYDNADGSMAGKASTSANVASIHESDYKARYFKSQSKLENNFYNDILNKWLQEASNGSAWHQFLLFSLRNNMGPSDYTGAISDVVGSALKPLSLLGK